MRLSISTWPLLLSAFVTSILAFEHVRLNKNDSMLLVVDHQIGLFNVVRDATPEEFRNNMIAHAAIGKLFNLPTILTTSGQTGEPVQMSHARCLFLQILTTLDRSKRPHAPRNSRDAPSRTTH